jgi:hypothetical protein
VRELVAEIEHAARSAIDLANQMLTYAGLSCRAIVYKALCSGGQLPAFYPDLLDPLYRTAPSSPGPAGAWSSRALAQRWGRPTVRSAGHDTDRRRAARA